MAINQDILNQSWEGKTRGTIEDGLKVLLADIILEIASNGIPQGGISISMLASSLADAIINAVPNTRRVNGQKLTGDVSIAVPTKTSDLQNDSGFITAADLPEDIDMDGYATTSAVEQMIAALVNSAPSTLDTLGELAAALGDDENAIVALTTAIGAAVKSISVNGGSPQTPTDGNVNLMIEAGAQGPKGDTGNVQVDGDGNVLIVNDLDQSEPGAGLDATQGKKLKDTIVSLATLVNSALEKVAWTDDDGQDIIDDIQDIIDELTMPIIYTDVSSLSFATTTGTAVTKTIKVHGGNLTDDISLVVSGTGFSIDKNSVGKNAGETIVTVTYNPVASGTNTGSIVLSSTGATSVTISLSGTAASEPAIAVDSQSLSMSAYAGETATATIKVTPINLSNDITLSVSGTGFSIDKQTISKDAGETTVTVTYAPASAGTDTGTITIASSGVTSKTVALSGTATAAPSLEAVFAQTSPAKGIYTCDKMDWIKQFLTVTFGNETIAAEDYTLSGTLTAGTSTLTVTYGTYTTTVNIPDVAAGVVSVYGFINTVRNGTQYPDYYTTNINNRSSHTLFDTLVSGIDIKIAEFNCNYGDLRCGIQPFKQSALDAVAAHNNLGSTDTADLGWRTIGEKITISSAYVGFRSVVSYFPNGVDTNIPDDFVCERVVFVNY